jgi:hypothetical protein
LLLADKVVQQAKYAGHGQQIGFNALAGWYQKKAAKGKNDGQCKQGCGGSIEQIKASDGH